MTSKVTADVARLKAAAQFKKKQEADRALADWEKAQQAEAAKTMRLRALRLAKEAEDAARAASEPPKPVKKAVTKKAKA